MIQDGLRAPHRECGDDHRAAPRGGLADDVGERVRGGLAVVSSISVGGFHDDVIGIRHGFRIAHHRIVVPTQVAGEHDPLLAPGDLCGGGAKDVPGTPQHQPRAGGQLHLRVEIHRREHLDGALGIAHRVERQRRLVTAVAVSIGVGGFLLLNLRTVEQDELGHGRSGGAHVDGAAKAILHQSRQVAGVIQVRVRQHHRVDGFCIDRQRPPVLLAQRLQALEQAAVHQQPRSAGGQQVLGSGDGAGTAEAGEREHLP